MNKKEIIEAYLGLEEEIENWCKKVVDLLHSCHWVDEHGYNRTFLDCYDYYRFNIYHDCIEIVVCERFRDYNDEDSIDIPIEVFYNNSEEEYVKNLYEKKLKQIEDKKRVNLRRPRNLQQRR